MEGPNNANASILACWRKKAEWLEHGGSGEHGMRFDKRSGPDCL